MSQYKIQHQAVQQRTPALQRQEPFGKPIIEPEWLEWTKGTWQGGKWRARE